MEKLKSSWWLLAFAVSIVIWYANVNSRLTTVEAKQVQQENVLQKILDQLTLLTINTTVNTQNSESMKEDIKEIKKELKNG